MVYHSRNVVRFERRPVHRYKSIGVIVSPFGKDHIVNSHAVLLYPEVLFLQIYKAFRKEEELRDQLTDIGDLLCGSLEWLFEGEE